MNESHRVLIFSPDPDLAKSIALLLEKHYEIGFITRLEQLRDRIEKYKPNLLLIDLFSFQGEIAKLLLVLQSCRFARPVVILRGYRQWMLEIEEAIRKIGTMIFYKPVDIIVIADAIQKLLAPGAMKKMEVGLRS